MANKKLNLTPEQVGRKYGFRSGLEEKVSKQLEKQNVSYTYEEVPLKFIEPAKKRTYTPDFILTGENDKQIVIETKGRFVTADRQKILMIREQYPDLDLRLVFSNSKAKISKASKTTYAIWCEKNGILYADKLIPEQWLKELK